MWCLNKSNWTTKVWSAINLSIIVSCFLGAIYRLDSRLWSMPSRRNAISHRLITDLWNELNFWVFLNNLEELCFLDPSTKQRWKYQVMDNQGSLKEQTHCFIKKTLFRWLKRYSKKSIRKSVPVSNYFEHFFKRIGKITCVEHTSTLESYRTMAFVMISDFLNTQKRRCF